ncbi:hypothetical protein TorRG33x02_356490 [Trema orientale]|uniref:Uncharacterized protein n=1 Tax=Trema orientale TaxID=63057 RepID=A0A2P5A753_TREOI|nr:hypothetical protein TorRG33x02_356490 [Trema orientale]
MESSSQVLGSSEECSGESESGWTMYIGSQIRHESDDHVDDKEEDENDNENRPSKGEDDNDESDDSMASDASSGPILSELGLKEGSQNSGRLRNRANVRHQSKCSSVNRKLCKQEKNRTELRSSIKGEKELQLVRKAESAASQV